MIQLPKEIKSCYQRANETGAILRVTKQQTGVGPFGIIYKVYFSETIDRWFWWRNEWNYEVLYRELEDA